MAAKAHALIHGQAYVACENIAAVAAPILRHRLATNFTAQSEGVTTDDVVRMVLEKVPQNETLG
jgi:MoxR-like ATPase